MDTEYGFNTHMLAKPMPEPTQEPPMKTIIFLSVVLPDDNADIPALFTQLMKNLPADAYVRRFEVEKNRYV